MDEHNTQREKRIGGNPGSVHRSVESERDFSMYRRDLLQIGVTACTTLVISLGVAGTIAGEQSLLERLKANDAAQFEFFETSLLDQYVPAVAAVCLVPQILAELSQIRGQDSLAQ